MQRDLLDLVDFNRTFSFSSFSSTPSRIGEYSSIIVFIRCSSSSDVRSSSFPVRIIFCSIYNPAALPLATSAFTAADHAPLANACLSYLTQLGYVFAIIYFVFFVVFFSDLANVFDNQRISLWRL